jgi:large subunit ribosomal protein L30
MSTKKKLKLTLVRSTISTIPSHKACVKGLGLRRMHHTVIVSDHPAIRGMIQKVSYLLSVEEV